MREPKATPSSIPSQGKIAVGAAGASLLELRIDVGEAAHTCVALVDSGASHCFLSDRVAQAAGLVLDTGTKLSVRMADGELRSSVGLARHVAVCLAPGVVQHWDFWVVPLAMDAILGIPWLRGV